MPRVAIIGEGIGGLAANALLRAGIQVAVYEAAVKTHMSNLYAKLGVHSRVEAVEPARTLGLLAPSAHAR